ncbi:MAG TPA: OB-fold domain-containing protein [Burkholderiaceae bacterium]|nr:OB-fold domain-containing protein [Burkholderiaceae bacterium]
MLKPQPRVNALSKPFWDGVNEGRIRLQRCTAPGCGHAVFYPRVCCPYCRQAGLEWFDATGRGRVLSHTTIHRAHHDGFNPELPYVFAAVELEEGVILYGQLMDAPVESQSLLGRQVAARFAPHGPGRQIVMFQLDEV